jgi:hypothetical protein
MPEVGYAQRRLFAQWMVSRDCYVQHILCQGHNLDFFAIISRRD